MSALKISDLTLRAILIIFAAIGLGCAGGLYDNDGRNSYARTNFSIFATVFAIVISGFLGIVLKFVVFTIGSFVLAVGDFLTTVFLFAAACSYADWGGVPNCSADYAKEIWGSTGKCREYQAGTAFLFLGFGVALGLTILSVMGVLQGGTVGLGRGRSAPRTGVPTMSQV